RGPEVADLETHAPEGEVLVIEVGEVLTLGRRGGGHERQGEQRRAGHRRPVGRMGHGHVLPGSPAPGADGYGRRAACAASSTTSSVRSISRSPCSVERKPASNADGAKKTPRVSASRWNL